MQSACYLSIWHLSLNEKCSKLIITIWEQRAEMLPCPHSLRLVHSGDGGLRDWKLIWDRGVQWRKRKEGQRHTERERKRERGRERVQRSKRSGPGGVPGFPLPRSSVYTQRNFGQFHSSPFSGHWKGTDSFLVTHPLSSESGCYHGKIQTFGILSGLPLCVAL